MQRLYCYVLTGIYCLYAFFYLSVDLLPLTGLLAAIISVCLSIYFNQQKITGILGMCYALAGFFFPEIFLFFPLLIGELGRMKQYLPILFAAVGFTVHFPPLDFFHLARHAAEKNTGVIPRIADITSQNLCYVLIGCLLALFLQQLCTQIEHLGQQFKQARDDSAELNFVLQERNRLLIEKQNYEIHNAMLQERNRIARELHDNAGHMLSRCILLMGMIKTMNTDEACADSLQLLDTELAKTMDTMRNSVHNLHAEALNLKNSIQDLLSNFTFCPVALHYDAESNIPSNVKYAFLAITKEALTNITKHSTATDAQIRVTEHPAMYQLIISDNGSAKKQCETLHDGIGLQNIRERVYSLQGTLQIIQENGFRIFVSIPKTR